MSQIKLSSLHMAIGDPREAAAVARMALDAGAQLRSRRALDEMRELDLYASRHSTITEAVELRGRMAETLNV